MEARCNDFAVDNKEINVTRIYVMYFYSQSFHTIILTAPSPSLAPLPPLFLTNDWLLSYLKVKRG